LDGSVLASLAEIVDVCEARGVIAKPSPDVSTPTRTARAAAHLSSALVEGAPTCAAVAFAAAWFVFLGYGPTLWPTNVHWMLHGDWAAYFWGFSFYREAPLELPLGAIPNLFHPYGTSLGFTDANPWASLPWRFLSPLLPLHFQPYGAWYLLCFVAQAWVGVRIARALRGTPVQQALGGALFAVTPLIPSRHGHIALCALFFVSAGVLFNVQRHADGTAARRSLRQVTILSVWAAGTHGYLSLMLLVLAVAAIARLWRVERALSAGEAARATLVLLLATLATYYAFGYVGWKQTDLTAEGFGQFSADLAALVNPQGWSRWFGALPYRPRQWEGFLYLGAGVLALLALALSHAIARPRQTLSALARQWPLLLALAAMSFYALSSRIAFLGEEKLNLESLYAPASALTGVFRSSGRFGWPLHVALLTAALWAALRLERRTLASAVLAGAVGAQAAELKPDELHFEPQPLRALSDPAWQTAGTEYAHLALHPMQLLWVCRYDEGLVNRAAYEAYRRKLTFNSGNFMRKEPSVRSECDRHILPNEPLDARTIYLVEPGFLRDFRGRPARCGVLDGLLVCVSTQHDTAILRALARHPVQP
jgi:Family of unknown function (DUF6311)